MRVAIDSGPLTSGHSVRGVGLYTRELIKALNEKSKNIKNLKIDAVDFRKEDLTRYDIVHYPYFSPFFITLPFNKPAKIVVTIHDLIPLIYPKHYPSGLKGTLRFFIQKYLVKKTNAIITVSETSKKDIVRFLGIPAEKVHVLYLAPKKVFRKLDEGGWKKDVGKRYDLPKRFALYVGDINYNKNIPNLIRACKIIGLPLVICGKQAFDIEEQGVDLRLLRGPRDWIRYLLNIPHPELAHYSELLTEFKGNKKILRLGFVSDKDLVAIFNLASVYVQPSFYEGFGLPVLEAMACGCPVVIAKANALVEIAGGAGLISDPRDPKDMAEKITEIIKNKRTEEVLIRKGFKRAKEFSWEKTAKETIKVYERAFKVV